MDTPAELIRSLRRRNGLTQQQLAIRLGTKQEAISRIERGHVSPRYATIVQALTVLGERPELACQPLSQRADVEQIPRPSDTPAERVKRLASWSDFICRLAAAGASQRKAISDG